MFRFRLEELRNEHHYSQAALARKIGVGQSTVGMWENGKNLPEVKKLLAIADLFDVSTDWLLGRDRYIGTGREMNTVETPLSDDEKSLLFAFRALGGHSKQAFLTLAQGLMDSPSAKEGLIGCKEA